MIKILEVLEEDNSIVRMCDMKPLQVGRVIEKGAYNNDIVMKCPLINEGIIINLTKSEPDECWFSLSTLRVKLLEKNEKLIIELSNE